MLYTRLSVYVLDERLIDKLPKDSPSAAWDILAAQDHLPAFIFRVPFTGEKAVWYGRAPDGTFFLSNLRFHDDFLGAEIAFQPDGARSETIRDWTRQNLFPGLTKLGETGFLISQPTDKVVIFLSEPVRRQGGKDA